MSLIINADTGVLKVGDVKVGFSAPSPDRSRVEDYPNQPFRVIRQATEEEFREQLKEYGVEHLRTNFGGEFWFVHTD